MAHGHERAADACSQTGEKLQLHPGRLEEQALPQEKAETKAVLAQSASQAMEVADDLRLKVTVMRLRTTGQLLCMEVGQDFVDLFFSLLAMPVGTVLSRLAEHGFRRPGAGISNVQQSMDCLEDSSFSVPRSRLQDFAANGQLGGAAQPGAGATLSTGPSTSTAEAGAALQATESQSGSARFMKKGASFMVSDELDIFEASIPNTIQMLRDSHGVQSMADLLSEEHVLGVEEADYVTGGQVIWVRIGSQQFTFPS